jgi:hypothetical protein
MPSDNVLRLLLQYVIKVSTTGVFSFNVSFALHYLPALFTSRKYKTLLHFSVSTKQLTHQTSNMHPSTKSAPTVTVSHTAKAIL